MPASDRSRPTVTTPGQRRAAVCFGFAIVAMIATIFAASDLMRWAAAVLASSADPRFPTHYSVGASMPFPVIMDHDNGWTFLAIFFALVASLAVEALVAARQLANIGKPAPFLFVVGLAAVALTMTAFPVTFSLDAYAYAAFGRLLGVHGLNPYVERLAGGSTLGDPVLAQLTSFLGTPLPDENYGPLWTWLSAGLAFASKAGGVALAVWMQRAAGAAALVIAALGVLRLHRALPPAGRAQRTALFALHPLALYESAAAGHNDMLMIAPAVWAFAIVDGSPLAAGALIGASISVKYAAALALPFLVARAYRQHGAMGAAQVGAVGVVVPALLFAPLWPGVAALSTLLDLGSTLIMSPQWLASMWVPFAGGRIVSIAFGVALFGVLVYSIVRYLRDRCIYHFYRSIAALLWSSPLLNPWYVQWLLPAASASGRWAGYAWWFGLFAMLRYVEDALRFPSTHADMSARVDLLEVTTLVILVMPIVLSLARDLPGQRVPAQDG
jgi:hypothetical protein